MRTILLGGVGVLALAAFEPATAADLRLNNRAPAAAVSPARQVAYSWSGFYVGAHAGWGWGNSDFIENNPEYLAVGFAPTQSVKSDGFLGGLQAGWNYQFGNWVAGIEGDVSWTGIKGTENFSGLDGAATLSRSADIAWLSTVTGRFGYAMDRWLVYGKGGIAFASTKYTDNLSLEGVGLVAQGSSDDKVQTGWTVGAGVEWAFLDRWSAKLEYNYMDFGSRSVAFNDPVNGAYALDIDNTVHAVKVGINYRFGGDGLRY